MAKKNYVLISLVTRKKLIKETYGRRILTLFYDKYPILAPQYANFYEPVNRPINNVDQALKYWEDQEFLCRRKNTVVGWWNISEDRGGVSKIKLEYDWNKTIDWLELFHELVFISEAYFSYVHVFTDREVEPSQMGSSVYAFLNGAPGFHLKKGIPNLGWANYFGEEYIKEINPDLLKQHGFPIQKLGKGYVFQITDDISDVINDYDNFNEKRKELKSLFRPDLFQKYERYS